MSQFSSQYQHPYAAHYANYTYPQQPQPQQPPPQQQYVQQPQQQYFHGQAQQQYLHHQPQQQQQQQLYYQQQQPQQQPQHSQQQVFPSSSFAGSTPGPPAATQLQPSSSTRRPHTPQPHRRHTTHHRSSSQQQQQHHSTSLAAAQAQAQAAATAAMGSKPPGRSSLKRRPPVSGVTTASAPPPPSQQQQQLLQSVPSIQRARTYSGGTDRPRLGSIRSRTNSQAARELPTMMMHVFLSIRAPDLLEVNNVVSPDLLARIENVCRDWQRDVVFTKADFDLVAKFSGRPFSSAYGGTDSKLVQRMLVRLFTLFGQEGYVSLTSVHNGSGFAAPRLVFVRGAPDLTCTFFAMTLHEWGVSFVDAPSDLVQNLALTLNGIFRRAFQDEEVGDRVIEVRRRPGCHVNKEHFHAVLLRYFNESCLKLDASISLGRTGLFGFGPRQELWIFKGSDLWQRAEKR